MYSIDLGTISTPFLAKVPISLNPALDGPLAIISSSPERGTQILQKTAMELVLEYGSNCKVHVFDPQNFGANLNGISLLPKELKANRVAIDASEADDFLKMARQRIAVVNQDILCGEAEKTCLAEFLETNPGSPERINILIIEGFPHAFNRDSTEKLLDVLKRGSSAGVYTFMQFDPTFQLDNEFVIKLWPSLNILLINEGAAYLLPRIAYNCAPILQVSAQDVSNEGLSVLASEIAKKTKEETHKIVKLAPEAVCQKRDAINNIRIAVGQIGGNTQWFEFSSSKNTYHALVGGATGSGKTVFLHNIILHGAASYKPSELQFCLLDFKEGTEFQFYQDLPHVRILSMEADASFGLEFLRFINSFIMKRGALFKSLRVSNYSDARKVYNGTLPRILIIVDEFQVPLSDQYRGASEVAELLDDISKRGRSFGIHLILSSQSLAGVSLRTSTLAQIPLRIALKLSKDDSERFLAEGNVEPAFFSRRGQAVMNSNFGLKSGNEYFNVSYVSANDMGALNLTGLEGLSEDDQEMPRKIYNPTVLTSWEDACEESKSNTVRLGKSFSIKKGNYATIELFRSSSYGAFLCSPEPDEIKSYISWVVRSLPISVSTVVVSDERWADATFKECRFVSQLEDLRDFVVSNPDRYLLLVVPDATACKAFRSSGYSKSEVSSYLVDLLNEQSPDRFQLLIGARNRARLSEFVDLRALTNELKSKIILRLGTNMEQEFGLGYGLKLQGSIAALLGEEMAEEFELFQKFEEALPD